MLLLRLYLGGNSWAPPAVLNIEGKLIRKQKELADCRANFYENKIIKK